MPTDFSSSSSWQDCSIISSLFDILKSRFSLTGVVEVGGEQGGTQSLLIILESVSSQYIDASTCISHRYLITKFNISLTMHHNYFL